MSAMILGVSLMTYGRLSATVSVRGESGPGPRLLCHHGEMSRMPLPQASDTAEVVAHVRRRGWIDFPLRVVSDDFVVWRRNIRREAEQLGMRGSVTRSGELVSVHNPDHEPAADERRATFEVMSSLVSVLLGPSDQPSTIVRMEDALQAERRSRLRILDET